MKNASSRFFHDNSNIIISITIFFLSILSVGIEINTQPEKLDLVFAKDKIINSEKFTEESIKSRDKIQTNKYEDLFLAFLPPDEIDSDYNSSLCIPGWSFLNGRCQILDFDEYFEFLSVSKEEFIQNNQLGITEEQVEYYQTYPDNNLYINSEIYDEVNTRPINPYIQDMTDRDFICLPEDNQ